MIPSRSIVIGWLLISALPHLITDPLDYTAPSLLSAPLPNDICHDIRHPSIWHIFRNHLLISKKECTFCTLNNFTFNHAMKFTEKSWRSELFSLGIMIWGSRCWRQKWSPMEKLNGQITMER
jgi:hypothetical protein